MTDIPWKLCVCVCMCVYVCVCVCVCLVWGEERERSCMGFVCMLSAELGQAFINFAWTATRCNAGPSQRHQSTSGYLSMWKPLYMAFMHVQLLCYCYYLSTITCKYIIGDHSLAITGHQGSSLSLKHGLRVSASLNSLHTAPLKTGQSHSICGRSPEASY